jgi:phosphoglycerate dehydrogenase-like enzyme
MVVSGKSSILVLPKPSLYRRLFSAEANAELRSLGHVVFNEEERDWDSEELARRIPEFDVVITGWRSPRFTEEVLGAATRLRLVAHSAGSIKFMFGDDALSRGFKITCVAAAMAKPVAEMSLMFAMMLLRPVHRYDQSLRSGGDWTANKSAGSAASEELAGQPVGVIGAGHTGRAFIKLLNAMEARVAVFDPFLTPERAGDLGARKVEHLDDLLAWSRVVSLQAPSTPETRHMIGRRELGLLRDGACLVNTARSWLVDQEALVAELRTGRISAALDVFDEEPLPVDHPLRSLPNVILAPHLGAATRQCVLRQGQMTVDEVRRFVRGEAVKYAITPEIMATMA